MVKYDCPECGNILLEIDSDLEENTIGYKLYNEGGRYWCPSCLLSTGKITSYVIASEDDRESEDEESEENE